MLIEEPMGLGRHRAAGLGGAQVRWWAGGGRGLAGVVGQVHEGRPEVGQGVERVLQELRGLQGRDGRWDVGHRRRVLRLLQLQLGCGLQHLGQGQRGDVGQGQVMRLFALLPREALLLLL